MVLFTDMEYFFDKMKKDPANVTVAKQLILLIECHITHVIKGDLPTPEPLFMEESFAEIMQREDEHGPC